MRITRIERMPTGAGREAPCFFGISLLAVRERLIVGLESDGKYFLDGGKDRKEGLR
jgi:hypothetical protein